MAIRIKDWERFQHFKDRRPPWIKLYRDILDDLEWHELDPSAAKALVMFWLIASEDEGQLPCVKELAFRLRTTEKQVESTISKLSHWLIQDDITPISPGYQGDPLEERREETETEKRESRAPRPGNGRFTPPALDEVLEHVKARGNRIDPIKFHAHYTANGWKVGKGGLPMKDWKAAIVTWERRN